MAPWLRILIIVLVILAVVVGLMYYFGNRMQKRQAKQRAIMEATAQQATVLIIDKKKLRIKQSGLPKVVYEQTPRYLRRTKVPVVKAKVGPKVMTLMAEPDIFEVLPLKQEVRVTISGLYITAAKPVRGGALLTPEKRRGPIARLRRSAQGGLEKRYAERASRNQESGRALTRRTLRKGK